MRVPSKENALALADVDIRARTSKSLIEHSWYSEIKENSVCQGLGVGYKGRKEGMTTKG